MFHVASITFQIHVLIQHFLLSSHLDSDPGVKEEGGKKIQTGYSNRDRAILDPLIRQRKCGEVKSKRGKVRACGRYWHCCPRGCVRRQHGQRLPEKSADLQLLCRFYFLISNLRQPPHNNMADPAYGTGATQLETRPAEVQRLRAGHGDEEGRQPPGWR